MFNYKISVKLLKVLYEHICDEMMMIILSIYQEKNTKIDSIKYICVEHFYITHDYYANDNFFPNQRSEKQVL